MHAEAYAYVAKFSTEQPISVVEVGSKNVNYTVRPLFPNADYWGIDAQPGPCVDEVADGATWRPLSRVDLVVCCEVFEHTPNWEAIVANCFEMLRPGGSAVFTCAGPGRPEHGVNIDDPDERGYYGNVSAPALAAAMTLAGFEQIEYGETPNESCGGGVDSQATGVRP